MSSVSQFLDDVLQRVPEGEPLWFRGVWDYDQPLSPSLHRRGADEEAVGRSFRLHAARELRPMPLTWWELMLVMQHYEAPTRLLDWTCNPLVGLFFAVWQPKLDATDGVVWCLKPLTLNRAMGYTAPTDRNVLFFGVDDDALKHYAPENLQGQTGPVAVLGPRSTPRLHAQQGAFVIFDAKKDPLDKYHDGKHVFRYRVPKDNKKKLRDQLQALNLNEMSMFPELDKIGRHIRNGGGM